MVWYVVNNSKNQCIKRYWHMYMRYASLLEAYKTREGCGSYYDTIYKVKVDKNERVINMKKINTSKVSNKTYHRFNEVSKERKQELLNNMEEYLVNYSSDFDFEKIGVSAETELNSAYDNCLGYIVELVGNDGDKYFFENILGFTKEDLILEGMEWVYE